MALVGLGLHNWNGKISKKIDLIKEQKEEKSKLKQQKINELLFKISIFSDSYEDKLEYANDFIQKEPILKDFDLHEFIENDTAREKSPIQKGLSYYISGSYDKALTTLKSILLSNEKDDLKLAIIEATIGKVYLRRPEPDLDKALKYLENSKTKFEIINRDDDIFNAEKGQMFSELGVAAKRKGLNKEAEYYYKESLAIFEELNAKHPGDYIWNLVIINQNLNALFSNLEELNLAFPFLKKALAYGKTQNIESKSGCSTLVHSISSAISYYTRLSNFDEAESYFRSGITIIEKCKNNYPFDYKIDLALANLYLNYSEVPFEQYFLNGSKRKELVESSIHYANLALKIYEDLVEEGQQFEHMIAVSIVHYTLGRANHVLGNFNESINEANLSIKILEQNFENYLKQPGIYSTRLGHNYLLLSRTFNKTGNLEAAKQNAKIATNLYKINLKDNKTLQDFINQANDIINNH